MVGFVEGCMLCEGCAVDDELDHGSRAAAPGVGAEPEPQRQHDEESPEPRARGHDLGEAACADERPERV